jgi:hypothetical protein
VLNKILFCIYLLIQNFILLLPVPQNYVLFGGSLSWSFAGGLGWFGWRIGLVKEIFFRSSAGLPVCMIWFAWFPIVVLLVRSFSDTMVRLCRFLSMLAGGRARFFVVLMYVCLLAWVRVSIFFFSVSLFGLVCVFLEGVGWVRWVGLFFLPAGPSGYSIYSTPARYVSNKFTNYALKRVTYNSMLKTAKSKNA